MAQSIFKYLVLKTIYLCQIVSILFQSETHSGIFVLCFKQHEVFILFCFLCICLTILLAREIQAPCWLFDWTFYWLKFGCAATLLWMGDTTRLCYYWKIRNEQWFKYLFLFSVLCLAFAEQYCWPIKHKSPCWFLWFSVCSDLLLWPKRQTAWLHCHEWKDKTLSSPSPPTPSLPHSSPLSSSSRPSSVCAWMNGRQGKAKWRDGSHRLRMCVSLLEVVLPKLKRK